MSDGGPRRDSARIVLFREPGRWRELREELERLAYTVCEVGLTHTVPLDLDEHGREALSLPCAAIVFTSARSAWRLAQVGTPVRPPMVVAVGQATAASIREHLGWTSDLVGDSGAESLARRLLTQLHPGARVLFPCAAGARDELPTILRSSGTSLLSIPLYTTAPDLTQQEALHHVLAKPVTVAVFASPSAVEALLALAGDVPLSQLRCVAIGPTTASALEQAGLRAVGVALTPRTHDVLGAIRAAASTATAPTQDISH